MDPLLIVLCALGGMGLILFSPLKGARSFVPERCYHFWTNSGTDCGRCITACPYSHPDNAFHRFIRWGIKNNLFFRHLAIKLDDLFYGRNPAIKAMPDWSEILD